MRGHPVSFYGHLGAAAARASRGALRALARSRSVCAQVRTGHRTQGVSVFTRMGDRFSTWDVSNGLQSLIPTLLTSG